MCCQIKRLYWEGTRVERSRVRGTQEDCSAMCLTISGFMGMGLVSRLSVANPLTQGPSWWRTHHSAKMDSSKRRILGDWVGHTASPFDLS